MDTKITKDPIVTSKMPSPSMEDMAFSEYKVFQVSVQLKLNVGDFPFSGPAVSVSSIDGVVARDLGVS